MNVTILMGGESDEHYLSIRSGKNIFNKINKKKYNVNCVIWEKNSSFTEFEYNSLTKVKNVYKSLKEFITNFKTDVIFNALHGNFEGDGKFNGLLELLNIPYTGNRFFTNFTGMDKFISMLIFKYLNLSVPNSLIITYNNTDFLKNFQYPAIVKPTNSGSSIGLKKVVNVNEAKEWIEYLFSKKYERIIIEEYINGEEYAVGIIGNYQKPDREKIFLPIAKISYSTEFFNEECKKNNLYSSIIPSGLPDKIEENLKTIALKIHNFFYFSGISRSDFIINKNKIYLLEVNTNPGLSPNSILTAMINKSPIKFQHIIDMLINSAINYTESR